MKKNLGYDMHVGPDGASVPTKVTWWQRLTDPLVRKAYKASKTPDKMVQADEELPSGFKIMMPPELLDEWNEIPEDVKAEILAGMTEQINEAKMRGELT